MVEKININTNLLFESLNRIFFLNEWIQQPKVDKSPCGPNDKASSSKHKQAHVGRVRKIDAKDRSQNGIGCGGDKGEDFGEEVSQPRQKVAQNKSNKKTRHQSREDDLTEVRLIHHHFVPQIIDVR
jgi:hypothetical protein